MRLHRGGRFRRWLGKRLGGDEATGDRAYRRLLHGLGASVLLYELVPAGLFGPVPKPLVLLLALGLVLGFELLRHLAGWELPTIRPIEEGRPASFAYFAVGLTVAVLLFPEAIAVAVVLGAALVDPLIGELRRRPMGARRRLLLAFSAYVALALPALWFGGWAWPSALGGSVVAALVALGAEGVRARYWDDDLAMPLLPGALLSIALLAWPAIPTL